MESLFRYVATPSPCGYLPDRQWSLEYEYVAEMTRAEYLQRMLEGWRRFGTMLFRPACQGCNACQALRVLAGQFRPDRSQRRTRKANAGEVQLRLGEPSVTRTKLALYDRYHAFQADARGWPQHPAKDAISYADSFVHHPFQVEEWCYYLKNRLVGVGYVDHLPGPARRARGAGSAGADGGLSAIYFFYDPAERHRSPGTWNVLCLIDEAVRRGLKHVYLGYYVPGCTSMSYKPRFVPNQIRGADGVWRDFGCEGNPRILQGTRRRRNYVLSYQLDGAGPPAAGVGGPAAPAAPWPNLPAGAGPARAPSSGMEKTVRKLLVASQKGGVGKTTTSINVAAATALAGSRVLLLDADPLSSIGGTLNLASHPERQPLRQAGVDLPGVLVSNVLPGLDVLSPYEEGGCSDDELGRLMHLLTAPDVQAHYGCLVLDTPPFLGTNPRLLLGACDEFVLVMRAEPLAVRTLPAFLELVQRTVGPGEPLKMRGILLTLPEGENPGGRWEREMRGRFGARILPQVIPHDEEVSQAALFGSVMCHANPQAPAAVQYHNLVEGLGLAALRGVRGESVVSALVLASAVLKEAEVLEPVGQAAAPASRPRGDLRADEPPFRDKAPSPPRRRQTPASAPLRRPTPPRGPVPAASVVPDLPETLPPVAPPAPAAPASTPRGAQQPPAAQEGFPLPMGLFWVAVAVVVGVGLRFLKVPDFVLPILVGLVVALLVVVLLRSPTSPPAAPAPRRRQGRSGEVKKARTDPGARLSGLKRRLRSPSGGDRSEN